MRPPNDATAVPKRQRRVYIAGKLQPKRSRSRPCTHGHAGPFHPRPDLDEWMVGLCEEAGLPAFEMHHFDCAECGSSIAFPRVRGAA